MRERLIMEEDDPWGKVYKIFTERLKDITPVSFQKMNGRFPETLR